MLRDHDAFFWQEFELEVRRVESFFQREYSNLSQTLLQLSAQADIVCHSAQELKVMDGNFQELYKTLTILENYASQNLNELKKLHRHRNNIDSLQPEQ